MSNPSPTELMRDMDAHLAANGIDPADYPWGAALTVPRPAFERRSNDRRAVPADMAARWGRPS
jgi:hypothetical protein